MDDIFKNNLDQHGIKYNEAYWKDMEDLLDKESKKKAFFNWRYLAAFISGVFVCLLGFLLIPNHEFKPTIANKTSTINQVKESQIAESNDTITTKDANSINENLTPEIKVSKKYPLTEVIDLKSSNKTETLSPQVFNNPISNSETMSINQTDKIKEAQPVLGTVEAIEPLDKLILKSWLKGQKSKYELDKILPLYCSTCKLKTAQVSSNTKDTSKLDNNKQWTYFMAVSSEYDSYKRPTNTDFLKSKEQTLNKVGYNLNFIAKKNRWGIKTGFGLLQLSEQTNYNSIHNSFSIDTVYRLVNPNYGVSPTGNTIALIKKQLDTTTTTWNTIDNPNAKVRFTYIKIPLIASYELGRNRFRFYMEAGINAAIRIKQTGNYTNYENGKYNVTSLKNNGLTSLVLMQSYTACGIKYAIGKSVNITAGYGFSKSLNSMMKNYSQKPNIQSILLGLEIRL